MEKKRKRASFSPEMPSSIKTTAKPRKEESETPVLKQVVEVLVEEPKSGKGKTQVNVVIPPQPQEQVILEEKPIPKEDEEEDEKEDEEEDVKVEEAPEIEEKITNTPEDTQEKEDSKPRITFGDARREEDEDRQKETVEELFGKNSQTVMPEITVHKGSNTRSIILWAVTMIAIAVGVGGGLLLFTGRNNKIQQPIPSSVTQITPTQEVTPEPTVIPTPAISRADLKVQVLNGGGAVGAGSKMKALLTDKGYTVSNVGNADSYTFDQTEIMVKESASAILPLIKADLEEAYTIGTMQTTLPASSPYDVVVTVGKK